MDKFPFPHPPFVHPHQVAALAAKRESPPDLSEPLGLLKDAASLVQGLAAGI